MRETYTLFMYRALHSLNPEDVQFSLCPKPFFTYTDTNIFGTPSLLNLE